MKVIHNLFLIFLFFLEIWIPNVCFAGENCDSLIKAATKASIEKDYQYSLELLSRARELAVQDQNTEKLFGILMNIGINKAELLDYDGALNYFFDAYKIAVEQLDKRHEMSILNNIAGLYMQDNKYDKADEYYMKVYQAVQGERDSLIIGGCAMNIAMNSMSLNKLERAGRFLEIAGKMLKNYKADAMKLYTLKVDYLLRKGKNKKAYDLAVGLYSRAGADLKSSVLWVDIQLALVNSCMALEDYQAAVRFSSDALEGSLNIGERRVFYQRLADAYYETGKYEKAFAYKDSVILATDSLWNITGKKQFENNRIQFELFKREKEFEAYRTRHKTGLIFFGLSVVIAVVLIWALANHASKNKQQKKIVELELDQEKKNQQLLQNKLEEQQAKVLLERRQFQHEIEMKGRELVSNALIVANRNEAIQEILDSLTASETIRKSKDVKLKEAIRKLRKQLNENEEWKNFTTYFEQVNDLFINSLIDKHPELTANEIRFLSLVYINLTTKEISSLLNITPEYCKKKKQQIAHKLGLDGTKSLYFYLISI